MIFRAWAYGYLYDWQILTGVLLDVSGKPFVRAAPLKRITGKQGRLRAAVVWHLSLISDGDIITRLKGGN